MAQRDMTLTVELLGIGATNDNHMAAAFVLADCQRVERVLGEWRIPRLKQPTQRAAPGAEREKWGWRTAPAVA